MTALDDFVLLRATLDRLSRVPARFCRRAADELTTQIHRDTAAGLDAHGRPFAPLRPSTLANGRHPPPMTDTGQSLAATRARPLGGAGIAIELGGHYRHHMHPTPNREARRVLPVFGMPAAWSEALRRAELQAVAEAAPGLARGGP
jgi:hypothetical protein